MSIFHDEVEIEVSFCGWPVVACLNPTTVTTARRARAPNTARAPCTAAAAARSALCRAPLLCNVVAPACTALLQDFEYDEETETYSYPCPCGDIFKITLEELEDGEDIARCDSCTLIIRVIYDEDDFEPLEGEAIAEAEAGADAQSSAAA